MPVEGSLPDSSARARAAVRVPSSRRLFPRRLSKYLLQSAPEKFRDEESARGAVRAGRVAVDGRQAADPDAYVFLTASFHDSAPLEVNVTLDDEALQPPGPALAAPALYYIDKPMHSVCDMSFAHDPITRACASLGPSSFFPIGQLDVATTGLLCMTDNGDLSRLMNLPGLLPKTYRVGFNGPSGGDGLSEEQRQQLLTPRDITRLSSSSSAADGATSSTFECFSDVTEAREVHVIHNPRLPEGCTPKSRYECDVTISSGQNHVVKRVMKSVGVDVMTLRRVAIGPLRLPGTDNHHQTCSRSTATAVPVRAPEPRRKKLKTNDSISRSTPTPAPVLVPTETLHELMEQLDYESTLARLRRCDLICSWKHSRDPGLGRWLCMTEREHGSPCYGGFTRLKCKLDHPPPDEATALSIDETPDDTPSKDSTDLNETHRVVSGD